MPWRRCYGPRGVAFFMTSPLTGILHARAATTFKELHLPPSEFAAAFLHRMQEILFGPRAARRPARETPTLNSTPCPIVHLPPLRLHSSLLPYTHISLINLPREGDQKGLLSIKTTYRLAFPQHRSSEVRQRMHSCHIHLGPSVRHSLFYPAVHD